MWFLLFMACSSSTPEAVVPPPVVEKPAPHWQVRSDQELDALLRETCEVSLADKKPILIEFSAPWCVDCKALEQLEHAGVMNDVYGAWHRVRIDVGRFERHASLRKGFGVSAIAYWVALRPTDCDAPVTVWPRLGQRVVELYSDQTAGGPEGLKGWLRDL